MSSERSRDVLNVKKKNIFSFFCSCLGSGKTDDFNQRYILVDDKDRYEYVVEKLAIKKVPLSVFGTEEDYVKSETETNNTPRDKKHELLPGNNRNYQSYFMQMSNKLRANQTQPETSSSGTSASDNCIACPHHKLQEGNENPNTRQNDPEIVSNILNKYSSLYTLDDKEIVPKDPLTLNTERYRSHSPTCPTIMGPKYKLPCPDIRGRRMARAAQIHETPQKEISNYDNAAASACMTKSMQRTITALGSAKPNTKLFLPRNCRGSSPPVRDGRVNPIKNVKRFQSEEIRCVSLDNESKYISHKHDQNQIDSSPKKQIHNTSEFQKFKQKTYRPMCKNCIKQEDSSDESRSSNTSTNRYNYTPATSHNSFPKVEEENKITVLPSHFSVREHRPVTVSDESYTTFDKEAAAKYNSEEPIMEINHMKGKNLKWKIIIKHHDDNEK